MPGYHTTGVQANDTIIAVVTIILKVKYHTNICFQNVLT